MLNPDDNFGKCPVCGGGGDDNSSPGSAFSTYAVPANLVSNGNFVDGVSSDWTASEVALTIALESTLVKGGYSAKLTPGPYLSGGAAAQYIYQDIHEAEGISYWQGKRVTLYCWVKTDTGKVNVRIFDGVGRSISPYHSANGQWELLKITRLIDASATMVRVELAAYEYSVIVGSSYSAYFDGVTLAENEDLALSIQARILREAVVDADGTISIETGTGHGYKLEYHRGELMCQMCVKRKKAEEEDSIAAEKRRTEQDDRDRFGFRRTMED